MNRLALVGLLLAASEASAQSYDPKLEVDPFVLTSDPDSVALTESARPLARGEYAFGIDLRVGGPPLDVCVKDTPGGGCTTEGNLVGTRFASDLVFALGFGRVGVHAQLPVVLHQSSDFDPAMGGSRLSSAGVGDARLGGKVQLAGGGAATLGLDVTAAIPTGGGANFIGDGGTTIDSRLLFDLGRGPLVFAANAGYAWRQHASRIANLYVDDEIVWSAAGEYRARTAAFGVAAFGRIGVVDDPMPPVMAASGNEEDPVELLASARFELAPAWSLEAGAGTALTSGYGAPPFRALLALRYVHRRPAAAPEPVIVDPPPPPPKDADGDGLVDSVDKCPQEPEDKDSFEDEDGCPDLDNDKDGIADAADKCPLEVEDKDAFEDDDGCPEVDNDKDGIVDHADKCPIEAEDTDGFEDDDGCPDLDNDKDGIADATDKCPLEAEVYNGVDDQDGCPDKGKELVQVTATAFEIKDSIYFDSNKATIKRRSFKLLDVIAGAIQANSGVRVRVEGHTDDRGTDEWNQTLSGKRAEAVKDYLIKKGIDPARLESAGFGKSRPKVEGTGEKARSQNRRVEFVIIK